MVRSRWQEFMGALLHTHRDLLSYVTKRNLRGDADLSSRDVTEVGHDGTH
jgi:hypothetical protein